MWGVAVFLAFHININSMFWGLDGEIDKQAVKRFWRTLRCIFCESMRYYKLNKSKLESREQICLHAVISLHHILIQHLFSSLGCEKHHLPLALPSWPHEPPWLSPWDEGSRRLHKDRCSFSQTMLTCSFQLPKTQIPKMLLTANLLHNLTRAASPSTSGQNSRSFIFEIRVASN